MTEHNISRRRFLGVAAAATGAAALAMTGCTGQPDSSVPKKEVRQGEELNAQTINVLRPLLGYRPGIPMDQYVRSITEKSLMKPEDFRKSIGSGVDMMLDGKKIHMGINNGGEPSYSPVLDTPFVAFAQDGTPTPIAYRDPSSRLAVQLWGNRLLTPQFSSLDQTVCLSMLAEWAAYIPPNQKVEMHFDFDGRMAASGIPNFFYPQGPPLPRQSPDSIAFQTAGRDTSSKNILFHAVVMNVPRAVYESRRMGVSSAQVFTSILVNEWHNVMAKKENRIAMGEGPSTAAGILSYIDPEFSSFILGGYAANTLAATMSSVCDKLPRGK